jgi:hypothetical protein
MTNRRARESLVVVLAAALAACSSAAIPSPTASPTFPPTPTGAPTATVVPSETRADTPTEAPTVPVSPTLGTEPPASASPFSEPPISVGANWRLEPNALPAGTMLGAPEEWGGGFFAVEAATDGTVAHVWLSDDGSEWQSRSIPASRGGVVSVLSVARGLVAVAMKTTADGYQFALWTSADGSHWDDSDGPTIPSPADAPTTTEATSIGGEVVIYERADTAVAAQASPSAAAQEGIWAWTQDADSTWTRDELSGADEGLQLAGEDGKAALGVLPGKHGDQLVLSRDGVEWQTIGALPPEVDPTSPILVMGVVSGYVLAADTGAARHPGTELTVWTGSTTGKWRQVLDQPGQSPVSLAASGTSVLLGAHASSLISPDAGASWSKIHPTANGKPACDVGLAAHRSSAVAFDLCASATSDAVLTLSLGGASPP